MIIYKAVFPNNKTYIGKTKNLESRKMTHFYNSKYNKSKPTKMKRAINKYGYENINWFILFENNDLDIINNKEKEYIILYNSINNGYNISNGGDGGDTISNNERKDDIIRLQYKSKGLNPDDYLVITEELGTILIDEYLNRKMSIRSIVKKYKINRNRVTRFLISKNIEIFKDKCVETNSKKFELEIISRIMFLYKDGLNIKNIAKSENLTILMVSKILHESGVRKSKRFKDKK